MTHVIADRVKETSSSTGTGDFTLYGAVAGFITFASKLTADGDTTWYSAVNGAEWEVGLGTRVSSTVLARTSVLASSNAGAATSFTTGPTVFLTVPAAATSLLGTLPNVFSKNQSVTPSTLTSGSSIAVDASLSNIFKLTLGVNATLANPTNPTDGMVVNIRIKQAATGPYTLAYGSAYKWPDGVALALTGAANAVDIISMQYDATDAVWACVIQRAFS